VAAPAGHGLSDALLAELNQHAGAVTQTTEPAEAVAGAQGVYTDTWTSMGQEDQAEARRAVFHAYQVDAALMARAAPDAVFLHCLPAHRGEEVTDEVLDSARSLVWTQARNRMRTARGALAWMLGAHR